MMGFGSWGLMGGLGMGFGAILWIAIIGLIVWAVVKATSTQPARAEDTTLEILKRRYARGEISQDEFDRAKQDLSR